jgi:hypothetical protein
VCATSSAFFTSSVSPQARLTVAGTGPFEVSKSLDLPASAKPATPSARAAPASSSRFAGRRVVNA